MIITNRIIRDLPLTKVNLSENIRHGAFQPVHDLLQAVQCDRLFALLDAEERRWRDPKLFGECTVGGVSSLFLEECSQLLFEGVCHQ